MKRWKVILGLLGIFIAGSLTGAAVTGFVIKRRATHIIRSVSKGDLSPIAAMTFKRFKRKLRLKKEQEPLVRQVVENFFRQVAVLRKQQRPQIQKILGVSLKELREVLSEEQFQQVKKAVANRYSSPDSLPSFEKEE